MASGDLQQKTERRAAGPGSILRTEGGAGTDRAAQASL